MAFRVALRRAALARSALATPTCGSRGFHATPRALVKVGDEIPSVDNVFENSAATKIDLAEEFKTANGYIVGVPGAFTGTCSSQHVPSYINHPKLKAAGQVFVLAVNDPFVMKAWADQLDPTGETGIRFVADPTASLTNALDLGFDDAAAVLGGTRTKRSALKVDNGRVTKVFIEPDNTGATVTMADKVLG